MPKRRLYEIALDNCDICGGSQYYYSYSIESSELCPYCSLDESTPKSIVDAIKVLAEIRKSIPGGRKDAHN
jgi:hypothetical protein